MGATPTAYLLFGAVWLRAVARFADTPVALPVVALLLVYLGLFVSHLWIAARFWWYPHLCFATQAALIVLLLAIPNHQGSLLPLFMALGLQAMRCLRLRVAFA